MAEPPPTVGLFVTCLVDLLRPSVGFAAARLLERAGCRVIVPRGQTCCGQPAYNSGARDIAAGIAGGLVEAFDGLDYVVAPSGSCRLDTSNPARTGSHAAPAPGARARRGRSERLPPSPPLGVVRP